MKLFFIELKRTVLSLSFIVVAIIYFVLVGSQLNEESVFLEKPLENQEEYGITIVNSPDIIYPRLVNDLFYSLQINSFSTYPIGFYRNIKLDSEKKLLLEKIIEEMTSYSINELEVIIDGNLQKKLLAKMPAKENLEEYLNKINSILGGGSFFSSNEYQAHYGKVSQSYKQALEEYELIKQNGFDIAHARLYLDYAGIFIALLSWFLPIGLWYADSKHSIQDIINTKKISSRKLFLTRFLAYIIVISLIVLIHFSIYEVSYIKHYGIENVRILKAFGLVIMWLLPIVIVNGVLSSLITIVTNTPFAVIVGVVSWFIINLLFTINIYGCYDWKFIPRHNILGNEQYFLNNFTQLVVNRIFWATIGIVLIIITIFILKQKREGKYVSKMVRYK